MTTTEPTTETQAILDVAASLLDCVGAADPTLVSADVALFCLAGAEHLERAGARAGRVRLIGGEPGRTIQAAMTALSQLAPDVFARNSVLEGAHAARRALSELG